jgi:5-methylcytosine-specific restriction endonuclease McrA
MTSKNKLKREKHRAEHGELEDHLRSCGCKTYSEYLKSELWNLIRQNVFKRKKRQCVICCKTASHVHHRNYNRETILGTDIRALVPLCRSCHIEIEFTDGKKNSLSKANKKLKDLLADQDLYFTDSGDIVHLPNDKTL